MDLTMLVNLMLLGAVAMACFTVSLFFLKFWKTTRDQFFLYFALSFGIEGCGRIISGLIAHPAEQDLLFYSIRLVAFIIILWAIIDKNWIRGRKIPAK